MATGAELAQAIRNTPDLLGIPHSTLDCQAAVEKALRLVGVNVNYRGSNHMWREMVTSRMSIDAYRDLHGALQPGLICFHLKNDGSEKKRGYNDDMGAAVHVGIVLDDQTVFHSGARGTEIIPLANSTFNRVAYCIHLSYDTDPTPLIEKLDKIIALVKDAKERLEELRRDHS